jgi:uncharacterized protein
MRTEAGLVTVAWPGDGDPGYLLRPSPDSERFFAELAAGRFVLRFCPACARPRYPHAPVCPYCGTDGYEWRQAPTGGTVLSWARCHLPYLPEFAPLVPYTVLDVQLNAGVRIIARLLSPAASPAPEPACGMRVNLAAERWPGGGAVPGFIVDQAHGELDEGSGW